eukprot:SAG11_NODE_2396_length_3406_cov_2.071666_4_plen_480_part_00
MLLPPAHGETFVTKQERAVNLPVAPMDFYEPQPDGFEYPAWADPQLVEMRRALWVASRHSHLGVCAAERLYAERMPMGQPSQEVRAEGERLRQFWTPAEQASSQAAARVAAARRSGAPQPKNRGNRRAKKLSDDDGLYLLTRVLRCGATVEQIAADFDVDQNVASRAFRSYAKAWSKLFEHEYPRPTWEEIRASTPACFDKKAGTTDTGLMVDATGVTWAHPGNPEMARKMWSDYYEMYAVIYQLGVTPGGCCVWVGPGQSPKLTDTQQCVLAGLLEFVWLGSRLLLDRGYKGMHFAARRKKIKVTMPFFRIRKKKKSDARKHLGREACRGSKRAAKNRAHNERQMSRLKAFRFFTTRVPVHYKDILDDLVWVAVCLGNLKCPLVETNAWRVESEETIGELVAQQAAVAAAEAESVASASWSRAKPCEDCQAARASYRLTDESQFRCCRVCARAHSSGASQVTNKRKRRGTIVVEAEED